MTSTADDPPGARPPALSPAPSQDWFEPFEFHAPPCLTDAARPGTRFLPGTPSATHLPTDPFPRRTTSATTTRSRQPESRLPRRPSPSTRTRAAGLPRWRRLRPGIERYPAPRRASQCSKKRAFTPKNDVAGPCNVVFSSNNVVARRKTTMSGLTTQLFDRTTTMFSLTTLFHAEKHQCLC